MRALLPSLLLLLLAGCAAPLPAPDAWMDECDGYEYVARGVLPGAFENASRDGSGFAVSSPSEGVPVGPGVAAFLGVPANVTSVRWRVDGGDLEESHRVSWGDGRLTSPEYLELRFWDGATVDGALDPERSPEDAAAVVQRFLDAVRGEQPDNGALAADLAPSLQRGIGVQAGAVDEDGDPIRSPEPPEPGPLPDGPWAVSSQLAAHAGPDTLRRDDARVVDGAWAWRLSVPVAYTPYAYAPGVSWSARVDPFDAVRVAHGSNVTLEPSAFRARLEEALPGYGLDADLDAWSLGEDGYARLCPFEPAGGPDATASP